jgi:hypothetical protein
MVFSQAGNLYISGLQNSIVTVYDIWGRTRYQSPLSGKPITVPNLDSGIYIVSWDEDQSVKVFVY